MSMLNVKSVAFLLKRKGFGSGGDIIIFFHNISVQIVNPYPKVLERPNGAPLSNAPASVQMLES